MIEIDQIKENYKNFDDPKIESIAKTQAKDIREDVVPVLFAEIERRGLGPELINWVKAERRVLSPVELDRMKEKVRWLPCPACGRKGSRLEGIVIRTVIGFIIGADYEEAHRIACEDCRKKMLWNAVLKTAFLGWWGLPEGFFYTPYSLIRSAGDVFKRDADSEKIMEDFIQTNIGLITLGHDKEAVISAILAKYNKIED